MSMFTHSIRWRFLFWLGFLLTCVLAGFGITAYQLHRTNQIRAIDQELTRRVAAVGAGLRGPRMVTERRGRLMIEESGRRSGEGLGPPGPPPRAPAEPGESFDFLFESRAPGGVMRMRGPTLPENVQNLFADGTNGFFFIVWSPQGTRLLSSSNAPPRASPRRRPESGNIVAIINGYVGEAYYFNTPGECILVGRSIAADVRAIHQFGLWLGAAGLAVLTFGLGGGWWLASRALQPVHAISAAASRISEGNLGERINVAETGSELGKLTHVLNTTFARLEEAFAQQQQFTADASHELRTPLAVLISELQTTLARERTGADYRETLEACLQTAQQMRRLTDSLLELARLDADHGFTQRERVNLAEVTAACVERLRPLAEANRITVTSDLQSVTITGQSDAIDQVITNLVSNAIHYNRPGGTIQVTTRAVDREAHLIVADTGIGIAAEDLPHIFKRFYRADKSRSRAAGHTGLGLAITKALVKAHRGTIEVESAADCGTTFRVRIFPSAATSRL
ncbi:MAG TPA: ATP-binding protein [Candidatus Acidoferrum sp.]|nr:ATP-binding protein [Candidatus Acidoferrum sp.]